MRFVPLAALAAATLATSCAVLAADADPVLIQNSVTQIRRSDFDAELLRLPPDARPGFANSEQRIRELLPRMLVTKTLAVEARQMGIDKEPEIVAQIANATQRFLAQVRLARVEVAAAKEFDAKRQDYEKRAHELYLADKSAYAMPEQVEASHILFSLAKHSKEEALALAKAARAKMMAGAALNTVAKDESEDPSATSNSGHLGWFGRDRMDPEFTSAAFMLAKVGDVSEPVLTRFGWHLIRLDGRRPAGTRPFDEVRGQIMAQLEKEYVDDKRDKFLLTLRDDKSIKVDDANVEALVVHAPDPALVRDIMQKGKAAGTARGAAAAPAK
jgi:peptidyl-prolyl cis-trans isomerase C